MRCAEETIGARLRRLRRERALSMVELADRAGLRWQVVQETESGAWRWPRPGTLRKLADGLGVDVRELTSAAPNTGRDQGGAAAGSAASTA